MTRERVLPRQVLMDKAMGRRPLPGVYAHVAQEYLASGIGVPVPLPVYSKGPPPKGYTGGDRRTLTPTQMRRWQRERYRHNVALVPNEGVIGLDVDAYDGKDGARTINRLEECHGPLPPTVWSSAREDGVSGIRLYRCPVDLLPPGDLRVQHAGGTWTGNIEVIRPGYRYMTVWPSRHPLRTRYRWYGPDGERLMDLPVLADLAALPEPWTSFMARSTSKARASTETTQAVYLRPPQDAPEVLRQWVSRVASTEDCRNNELNRAAYALGGKRDLSDEVITQALLQAALSAGLGEHEATKTIASGLRSGRRRPYS